MFKTTSVPHFLKHELAQFAQRAEFQGGKLQGVGSNKNEC